MHSMGLKSWKLVYTAKPIDEVVREGIKKTKSQ